MARRASIAAARSRRSAGRESPPGPPHCRSASFRHRARSGPGTGLAPDRQNHAVVSLRQARSRPASRRGSRACPRAQSRCHCRSDRRRIPGRRSPAESRSVGLQRIAQGLHRRFRRREGLRLGQSIRGTDGQEHHRCGAATGHAIHTSVPPPGRARTLRLASAIIGFRHRPTTAATGRLAPAGRLLDLAALAIGVGHGALGAAAAPLGTITAPLALAARLRRRPRPVRPRRPLAAALRDRLGLGAASTGGAAHALLLHLTRRLGCAELLGFAVAACAPGRLCAGFAAFALARVGLDVVSARACLALSRRPRPRRGLPRCQSRCVRPALDRRRGNPATFPLPPPSAATCCRAALAAGLGQTLALAAGPAPASSGVSAACRAAQPCSSRVLGLPGAGRPVPRHVPLTRRSAPRGSVGVDRPSPRVSPDDRPPPHRAARLPGRGSPRVAGPSPRRPR